ncbi:olfactory receptor 2D3-like [Echinops telfairi]|uniref:Olfactory receptor 2D3-like n=1 Tax=Echinops telfairi TaxID=9371 RepID=A0AC55D548_ECHTE|nr:olfactory receptor 2D3-like [Echinops telfairi]
MEEENHTSVTEFVFLGLSQDPLTQVLLFFLFLIIYLLTVLGNLLIIVLIHIDSRLHTPMYFFAMGVGILLAPVSLILVSYWNIISTVIRMQSGEGRLKVFSTCGSHLIVVVLFYGSAIFAYMRPNAKKMSERDKVISVFYSAVTPMLNPIIYSLRNKDVKGALRRITAR